MAALTRLGRAISRDPSMRLRAATWGLALCPLLFVPPIGAMLIAWGAPSQRSSDRRFDPTWITIIAILNLAVSAGVIHRFGFDLSSIVTEAQRLFIAPRPTLGQPHLQSI